MPVRKKERHRTGRIGWLRAVRVFGIVEVMIRIHTGLLTRVSRLQ